ncbi:MAG: hypothetical protein ABIC04_01165 [Nanoarchaeota archaeon]
MDITYTGAITASDLTEKLARRDFVVQGRSDIQPADLVAALGECNGMLKVAEPIKVDGFNYIGYYFGGFPVLTVIESADNPHYCEVIPEAMLKKLLFEPAD